MAAVSLESCFFFPPSREDDFGALQTRGVEIPVSRPGKAQGQGAMKASLLDADDRYEVERNAKLDVVEEELRNLDATIACTVQLLRSKGSRSEHGPRGDEPQVL